MSEAMKRVGLYGGAFDPPHLAHRALAEVALAQLALDALLIIPTGHAWHKSRPLTDAAHRVAMCQLTFGDLAKTRIDDREILREGPSYTIDTVQSLHDEWPDAQLFLLMGADQLRAFRSWYRWEDLLRLVTLAVADRADRLGTDALSPAHEAMDLSDVDIPHQRLQMPLINVSATALRHGITDQPADDLVHGIPLVSPAVASYISQHNLYRTHP